MFKPLLSVFVVTGILYGLYLTQPQKDDNSAFAKNDWVPEEPATKGNSELEEMNDGSPQEGVASDPSSQSMKGSASYAHLIESEMEKMDEAELLPPKLENSELKPPKENKPTLAKSSGELVLENTRASAPSDSPDGTVAISPEEQQPERPGFDALPSKMSSSHQGVNADIYFAFDSYELSKTGSEVLTKLAARLISDPALSVQIEGHTDAIGDPEVNKAFSAARAQAVLDKLSSLGVSKERMKIGASSSRKPIEKNSSATGRSANRRVEVRAIKGT